MDNLYIPKNKKSVEILLNFEQETENYEIYLNKFSRFATGEETLIEFLNSGKNFIPATEIKTKETSILNIDNIIYLLDLEIDHEINDKKIEIYLNNNQTIIVDHFEDLPLSHSRPLDALNDDRKFLPYLFKSKIIFINKKHIAKVVG